MSVNFVHISVCFTFSVVMKVGLRVQALDVVCSMWREGTTTKIVQHADGPAAQICFIGVIVKKQKSCVVKEVNIRACLEERLMWCRNSNVPRHVLANLLKDDAFLFKGSYLLVNENDPYRGVLNSQLHSIPVSSGL